MHISATARVSNYTQGYTVPRGGVGVAMETVPSMMIGYDTTVLLSREVRGIAACLRLKQPVYVAAVVMAIQESDTRAFMPLGVLVTRENLPDQWTTSDGVISPPGLLSGRDFRGITSPLAYAAIPSPWSSVIAAVKWANVEFNVAITPWVFCQLATVMWQEDPVTKAPLELWNLPWEVLEIPFPVLEALAVKEWVPWHVVNRIEAEACWQSGMVSMYAPIPLA